MMARPYSVHLGERIIAAVADGTSSTRACGQRASLMTAHLSGRRWRTLTFGPCATTDEAPIAPRHHGTGFAKAQDAVRMAAERTVENTWRGMGVALDQPPRAGGSTRRRSVE